MSSPYRTPAKIDRAAPRDREPLDGSVTSVFALFWGVSGLRVILAIVAHEVFGAEASLALLAFVLLPLAVGRAVRTR